MSKTKNTQDFGAAPHERPVPRISIHGFCELPETATAMQNASSDRRLSKAHVETNVGGITAAVEHYRGQVTPNLLIVETRHQGREALEDLDRLAEVCDPATKVIVIGAANDVELYRELMRRGAAEYLVGPIEPLRLIEVIAGLYLDPEAKPIGRVISVIGARGGAGSSVVAHNVGWVIAEELHINTTIIDFDLPYGTVGLDFNEDSGQGTVDALADPERLDDVLLDRILIKHGEHLSLFTSPALIDREYETNPETYESVVQIVRNSTPCVILDLPHVWSDWVRHLLVSSDEIIVVATPDLASLRNAKNIIELVRAARPNDTPPRLVLNQVGQPKRPEIPAKDFADTINVEPASVVPYEPALFGAAANNGQMLSEVNAKAASAEALRRLAGLITGRAPAPEQKSPVLLSILKGKKRA